MNYLTKYSLFIFLFLSTTLSCNNVMQDLEIQKIFAAINNTCTHQGEKYLLELLSQPTNDTQLLEKRQAIIALFSENKPLQEKIATILTIFKKRENIFSSLSESTTSLENAAIEPFYYSSARCKQWNHNPLMLDLGHLAHIGNLLSSVAQHTLSFVLLTWGIEEAHACTTCSDHHHHKKKENDSSKDKKHKKHAHKVLIKYPNLMKAFQLWHSIAQVQELYAVQKVIQTELQCIKQIQAQLISLKLEFHAMHAVYTQVSKYPLLTESLEHFCHLQNLCEKNNISQKLTNLLLLLEENTFKGKPSSFSRIGNILAAYKLAEEVISELSPALTTLGEIDAYLSCAKLFTSHQDNQNTYSFASYIKNAESPEIEAINYWHPLLNANSVVFNSMHLTKNTNTRNIILTAPNASGKSTNLKTLTLCSYLAQTITIVPAENYSLTPFTEIYSSIVVTDNIEKNMSLFATELQRAEELLSRVQSLQKNEFIFIALDELFTSTANENGQKIAERLLKLLYSENNVMSIISTHFEKLTKCAKEEHYQCSNYTVDNFILKPGISSAKNSFDVIKQKGNKDLLLT